MSCLTACLLVLSTSNEQFILTKTLLDHLISVDLGQVIKFVQTDEQFSGIDRMLLDDSNRSRMNFLRFWDGLIPHYLIARQVKRLQVDDKHVSLVSSQVNPLCEQRQFANAYAETKLINR